MQMPDPTQVETVKLTDEVFALRSWSHLLAGTTAFKESLDVLRGYKPKHFASTHAPAMDGRQVDTLCQLVVQGSGAPAFQVPTHEQFEQMMAHMAAGGAPPH